MLKYKLTDQKMQTHGGFKWELGKWYEAKGDINLPLCTDGWLHCYDSPLLAMLHNPMHANISNPRLFGVEVDGESKGDNGLKCGYRKMRLVKELPLPNITLNQRLAYGILCAKKVYEDGGWNTWADGWLNGRDRSRSAAAAYAAAAYAAADAYADAAAAYAAADAAAAAAYADAADAYAAYAADAAAAAAAIRNVNLHNIAEKAMKY